MVVYYVELADKMIKIGTTTQFDVRMLSICPTRALAVEPGDRPVEQARHHQFRSHRLGRHCELFYPHEALNEHIAEAAARYPIPNWSRGKSAVTTEMIDCMSRMPVPEVDYALLNAIADRFHESLKRERAAMIEGAKKRRAILREMMTLGTQAVIAEKLGISKQRVYQLAQESK